MSVLRAVEAVGVLCYPVPSMTMFTEKFSIPEIDSDTESVNMAVATESGLTVAPSLSHESVM